MENGSRDLLCGIGGGDEDPGRGERKAQRFESRAEEEVELSLGLSLGGRFGAERRSGQGLARSSSVACIQDAAPAPPELARTNSLPTRADAQAGNKQSVGDRTASLRSAAEVQPSPTTPQGSGGFPLNGTGASPAVASPRASLSPSQSSSSGEGILTRTSSLPAGIEDLWRKRKVAQALKRIEVKRRIERMNSSNISVEEVGDEMNATAKDEKVENCDDLSMKNEQTEGKPKVERMNHSNVRRRLSGLPPPYQPPVASQGTCLQGKLKMQNSALKGTPGAEGRSPSSAVVPSSNGTNGVLQAENGNASAMAPASSSATAVTAAALGSRGEQQDASERPTARRAREMPLVYTSELPNGRRIEGFLYKYSKVDEVRIVCVCHGSFLTPAEFVEHAGGGQVARPMRHIVVNPPS